MCSYVSLDHFGFVLSKRVLLGLVFFSTEPRDWLGRTSLKWPMLCRVGRKTLLRFHFWFTLCHFNCLLWKKEVTFVSASVELFAAAVDMGLDLQNILQQSYDYLTIMQKLQSTYEGRLFYKTSYKGCKSFLMVRFTCRVVRSSETVFSN